MRVVFVSAPGEVSLNYMWLPTWLGMNTRFKTELEKEVGAQLQGILLDDAGLDKVHDAIIEAIITKFSSIPGLRDYLDALKFVEEPPPA
jgi:hypothetical protein